MKTYSALLVTFLLATSTQAFAESPGDWCVGLATACQQIQVGPSSPVCSTVVRTPPSLASNCCDYLQICPPPQGGGEFGGEMFSAESSDSVNPTDGTPGDGLGLGDISDTNTDFTPENFNDDGPSGFSARRDSRSFFSNGNSNAAGREDGSRNPSEFFK